MEMADRDEEVWDNGCLRFGFQQRPGLQSSFLEMTAMGPKDRKSGLAKRLHSLSGVKGSHDLFKHYSRTGAALNLRILPPGEGEVDVPSVLIEGDKDTIVFLADLLLSQVLDCDCGTGISPVGPGSVYFNPQSQCGIYIHVLPCKNEEVGGHPAR
jgi:hypothetical protein